MVIHSKSKILFGILLTIASSWILIVFFEFFCPIPSLYHLRQYAIVYCLFVIFITIGLLLLHGYICYSVRIESTLVWIVVYILLIVLIFGYWKTREIKHSCEGLYDSFMEGSQEWIGMNTYLREAYKSLVRSLVQEENSQYIPHLSKLDIGINSTRSWLANSLLFVRFYDLFMRSAAIVGFLLIQGLLLLSLYFSQHRNKLFFLSGCLLLLIIPIYFSAQLLVLSLYQRNFHSVCLQQPESSGIEIIIPLSSVNEVLIFLVQFSKLPPEVDPQLAYLNICTNMNIYFQQSVKILREVSLMLAVCWTAPFLSLARVIGVGLWAKKSTQHYHLIGQESIIQ